MKIFYDTETCGLVGVPVLIQYASEHDPEIKLHHIWMEPIHKTLRLIEWMMDNEVVGFNLTFDHFHLCKIYTMFWAYTHDPELAEFENEARYDNIPYEHIKEIAKYEKAGMDGPCLKPRAACDLMLLARKGKYQVTMERSDIRIKRVPTVIAWDVAKELEERILFDPILFARQKVAGPRWQVRDIVRGNKELDRNFKDIVLKFKASAGLKALAVSACNFLPEDVIHFKDVEVPKAFYPDELEYAPFADAVKHEYNRKKAKKNKRNVWQTWVDMLEYHVRHWKNNPQAQLYAKNDVVYTRALWEAFDKPECGDVDSELACCVAAVRWRGYAINVQGVEALLKEAQGKLKRTPISPAAVKKYLFEVLSQEEQVALNLVKTGKVVLESMIVDPLWKDHPAALRAREVLDARFANDEIKLYKKLLIAGRLHFGVKVIGALSSRMAGDNKLNPQGIKRDKHVRKQFTFAHGDLVFYGGDFDAFEVGIADAIYKDPEFHKEIASGEKIHTLFALALFAGVTKEQVLASKGDKVLDMYDMGKRGVFSQIYMGNENTLVERLGISLDVATAARKRWLKMFPGIARAQQRIVDRFSSMKQTGGIGTRIVWNEPDDFVESLLGHRRYFTLENRVCKALFDLANKPLPKWKAIEGKVVRRERTQTIGGAVMSALYACAFSIQSSMTRQAGNHEIQSTGAQITKDVQAKIWRIQPHGVHKWLVQPCNVHDEILCPLDPSVARQTVDVVQSAVEFHRQTIPLIKLDFQQMGSWADK